MNISKRLVIALLVAAIVLFVGMLFWPFILNSIIEPTATAVWLLLRLLVLNIDQKYFWFAVISLAVVFLFRFLRQEQSASQPDAYPNQNATILNIGYWRVLFTYDDQNVRDEKILKRELTHLVTSLYASKQSTSNDFHVHEDLQQGRIPLPENIHKFLFATEPESSGGPIKRFLQSIRKSLQRRIRQWTGQEKAEYYQTVEEVLSFLETSMEIKK